MPRPKLSQEEMEARKQHPQKRNPTSEEMNRVIVAAEGNINIVMENEKDKIAELKRQGYKNVTIWNEVTAAGSVDHSHPFDTHLVVLDGEIEVIVDDQSRVLKTSEEIDIPRGTMHHSRLASKGCRYITAERFNS